MKPASEQGKTKINFFDSHIHLNHLQDNSWRNSKDWIFNNISMTLEDLSSSLEKLKNHNNIYLTIGIHPVEINNFSLHETMKELDRQIQKNRDRVIAIGETGLDFYCASKEEVFENQKRWFYAHYELAKKHNLPLMLHIRRAHSEMFDLLREIESWYGILHAFEANEEILNKYLSLSGEWMFSVSPVTLRKNSHFRKLLHKVDINKLLVESDAPFIGKSFKEIETLIEVIALEKDLSFDECKEALWNNFCRVFGVSLLI